MSKYGPTRGELRLRLGLSVAGLAGLALAYGTGALSGLDSAEIFVIAGGFFGGTVVWTLWKLIREEPK